MKRLACIATSVPLLFLLLSLTPSVGLSAGVCCFDPTKTCDAADGCDEGPCGPPCDDHLKCYRIIDPLALEGVVDIDTKQFGLEPGCKIESAKVFCVPATKHVREATDLGASPPEPIDLLPIFGPPAPGDRICYSIKCPKPYPEDQVVSDQFGTREVKRLRPTMLCTPAVKRVPPPPPCGETSPECNGQCPPDLECAPVPGADVCGAWPVQPGSVVSASHRHRHGARTRHRSATDPVRRIWYAPTSEASASVSPRRLCAARTRHQPATASVRRIWCASILEAYASANHRCRAN
jgi:hypothetical protein